MALSKFFERLRRRRQRREYRQTVKQWYVDGGDARFRFDYPLDLESLVLDLGGYEGRWASDLYARQRCRIHVFEPIRSFAAAITERFQRNADIEVFACALGGSTRHESLSICGASSSAYKDRSATEEVEFIDVKEWFDDHGIDSVALMKINIEGGEYELLERMIECDLVRRVVDLQVQFHNFAPDAAQRMVAIQTALSATHRPTYQYRFVWENWTRIPPAAPQ
jgi:FkbM family methyltransferase